MDPFLFETRKIESVTWFPHVSSTSFLKKNHAACLFFLFCTVAPNYPGEDSQKVTSFEKKGGGQPLKTSSLQNLYHASDLSQRHCSSTQRGHHRVRVKASCHGGKVARCNNIEGGC